MSDDQVIDAVLAELDKSKSTLRLAAVVCLQADPLLVSIDGIGSVPALQQGITMGVGDAAWALWAPPRKPIVIAGATGGGSAKGLFGTGVDQSGVNANAGGDSSVATGSASLAVGWESQATGDYSTALGHGTEARGQSSYAEGTDSVAYAENSHAEGDATHAQGANSHAEGGSTTASGEAAHSEGDGTTASGDASHAQGGFTIASSDYAHAQGYGTNAFRAIEDATAAEGDKTLQHTQIPIAGDWGTSNVSRGSGTDPIRIPVHDGHFDAKLTVFSLDMADRWDITFRGSNDASNFAGRAAGTVTIDDSAGGGAPIYGSSPITWTVAGTSIGDVEITPSDAISNRYVHVELFELRANN